jgi:hypothetical protein
VVIKVAMSMVMRKSKDFAKIVQLEFVSDVLLANIETIAL